MLKTAPTAQHNFDISDWLSRAVDLDEEAVERVIVQLGSAHPALQEIIKQQIYKTPDAELWRRLLDCVALHRWHHHSIEPHHLLTEHEAVQRIENAVCDLFTRDVSNVLDNLQPIHITSIKIMVLREGLHSPQPDIRIWAAILLARRGEHNDRIVDILVEAVHDEGEASHWRTHAVRALGRLGDARGAQVLVEALADAQESMRQEAAQSLVDMGTLAVPALSEALAHALREVRWHAVHTLGAIGDARAAPALAAALGDEDSAVSWAAGEALATIGKPCVPAILEWLTRHPLSHYACRSAYHALRQMPSDTQEYLAPVLAALNGQAAETSTPTAAYHALHQRA